MAMPERRQRGRPRRNGPPPDRLVVLCSAQEKASISARAKAAGLSASAYLLSLWRESLESVAQ